jgi:hypothetical protein
MPDGLLQAVPGAAQGADPGLQLPHRPQADGPVLQVAALQHLLTLLLAPLQLQLLLLRLRDDDICGNFPNQTCTFLCHPLYLKVNTKTKFLDEIQTKVLRVFLLVIQSHLYSFILRFYISSNSRNLLQFL